MLLEWSTKIGDGVKTRRHLRSEGEVQEAGGSMSDGVTMELLCKIADVAGQIKER